MFEVINAGIRFSDQNNRNWLFRNVNFTISEGEIVALMGPSGIGKTTLIQGIAGLRPLTEGYSILDGKKISGVPQRQVRKHLRKHISMVFQNHLLVPGLTLLENIELSWALAGHPGGYSPEEVLDSLRIGSERYSLPESVSGGQSQRAAVARALVSNPKLLLADEPTGALDTENAQRAFDEIFSMCRLQHSHVLIVTHDPNIAQKCDRIIRLESGVIHD
ncbi:ATP-binding cassette domain-containing protein [Corynebacterium sp. sy017]|uniref:ABC transporter ATP-binding protein n=1 Tax=unclassified Corynebacterium TaxID=2624378 RepID=UPI0011865955|nr:MULTISPECIES: ATP-binding cassette domain-containing protein [unclassified Corynebacterium]MBP3089082.1 ATP-binding cassette domain-containing protein [Corynebacterium sp. sy017]TSD91397.1 ATP-binding cassette domain-containing protein [Corynebacterium sp. SY003]